MTDPATMTPPNVDDLVPGLQTWVRHNGIPA
ncbi:hypothetical protein BN000_00123 [Mycobacterium europaeum]|uniref:Uncharacterized protein n=1 Tax=Mycobacterium europaeum TaxID=761804 RepID=A0A0U1CU81_9MYCO|nr:hypothetical protein O981_27290 [Mycobacterium avium 10-5560]CQD02077.1 hypothetical protein BN000_00123 [Mycobacterium europaeum]